MKIAIASGKGGTGKTTVSIALVSALKQAVQYLDCDVEEPNGNLFLELSNTSEQAVTVKIPKVNTRLCNGCGDCAEICQFNAIVTQGHYALVFPELCHSCGGCMKVCAHYAITEIEKPVGSLLESQSDNIVYIQGRLNIGEALSLPVIRAVKNKANQNLLTIIDCPPGTSCPMIETVCDADYVILVTEPTPFGLHDLKLAVETVRNLHRPFAVIINRSDLGDDRVETYCQEEQIKILLKIPETREAAQASSNGQSILTVFPEMEDKIQRMIKGIHNELQVMGTL